MFSCFIVRLIFLILIEINVDSLISHLSPSAQRRTADPVNLYPETFAHSTGRPAHPAGLRTYGETSFSDAARTVFSPS